MSAVRFSVVIPVFNKERHVVRCIESVLAQTLAPFEIIAVDDNSSDNSMALIRAAAGDRVTTYARSEPGPGGYAARNLAIESAKGEWIAFLDADDAWAPDHLETLARTIAEQDPDVGCVFSGYLRRESAEVVKPDWYTAQRETPGRRTNVQLLTGWLAHGCPLWMGAVAARRQVLIEAGLFPAGKCRRGGDRVLWLQVSLRTVLAYTGKVTATYYCDSDNMITKQEQFSVAYLQSVLLSEIGRFGDEADVLLKKLFNEECYTYVAKSWKRGLPLTVADAAGYFVGLGLAKYVAIRAMIAAPIPVTPGMRQAVRRLRGRA